MGGRGGVREVGGQTGGTLEVSVLFMQESQNKSIDCYSAGSRIEEVMRIRV